MVILSSTNKKSYLVVASFAACYSRELCLQSQEQIWVDIPPLGPQNLSGALYVILHDSNLSVSLLSHVMALIQAPLQVQWFKKRKTMLLKNLHNIIAEVPL